jgi:N-methylhydantoinase A
VEDFHAAHERAYAFASPGDPCEIQTIRLSLSARPARRAGDSPAGDGRDVAPRTAPAILDGRSVECHIVDRRSLAPGDSVPVPCVLVQEDATTVVPPGVRATVHDSGALIISEIPAA